MTRMDEQALIVARAIAGDDLRLEPEGQETMRVYAGKPFSLRFAYKIYETSRDEDAWRFRIRSGVAGQEPRLEERSHHDRKVFTDDVWTNVSVEHLFVEPGDYELEFTVEAEMARRSWGDVAPHQTVHKRDHTGRVRVKAVKF